MKEEKNTKRLFSLYKESLLSNRTDKTKASRLKLNPNLLRSNPEQELSMSVTPKKPKILDHFMSLEIRENQDQSLSGIFNTHSFEESKKNREMSFYQKSGIDVVQASHSFEHTRDFSASRV
jgi:hypothetical protein